MRRRVTASAAYLDADSSLQEMFATVAAMGGTSVRSHTLGTSVGHPLSIMPSLGRYNEEALRVVDFAVYAAQLYVANESITSLADGASQVRS